MKEYYKDKTVTIYHGDSREIAPTLELPDLVIIDPPYGMNFRSSYRIIKHDSITGDEFLPLDLIQMSIDRAKNAAYVFCRWDNLGDMPKPKSVLAWIKNNWSMGDLKHEHGRQWEAICFYAKEGHEFIKRIPDVVYADRTGNKLHPTQKPTTLLAQLIECNVAEPVHDYFMGSGSTLRAAKDLGRKAVGIDIDEKNCEIAANRMSQEVFGFA